MRSFIFSDSKAITFKKRDNETSLVSIANEDFAFKYFLFV